MKRVLGLLAVVLALVSPAHAQPSDRFKIAINYEPDSLDLTSVRDLPSGRPTLENINEMLVGVDKDGNITPGLASWTLSDDHKTIDFKLRQGVKFHSGDELTAEDVVFSHERMLKNTATYRVRARNVESITAVDRYTARLKLKEPNAGFLWVFPLAISSKTYFDRVGEKEFTEHPVGTGPYKFAGYAHGQYLDLDRNDDYWGPKPNIEKARFVFITEDTTRVAALRAGEIDMVVSTPFPAVEELKKSGFKIVLLPRTPTPSIQFQFVNTKVPWADRRVREAIAHAIDMDAIIKGALNGVPARYARFAPTDLGYDPDLKPYSYDPALSKKLLAEAGYPNGFKMPLYYFANAYSGFKETAEAIILYLRAVGINATPEPRNVTELTPFIRKVNRDPNAELVVLAPTTVANYPDPVEALVVSNYSKSNLSLYVNPKFDEELEAAEKAFDPKKRADLLKIAVRTLHEDVGNIPTWSNILPFAMKPNVDYTPTPKLINLVVAVKEMSVKK
jgi:peptide/nickel transport system substrate-binding protein